MDRPGHADIGHIAQPAGEYAFIRGLHMRMRAPKGRDLSIDVIRHGDLLARCARVEIDHGEIREARGLAQ